jgi:hypothetical protein
MSTESRSETYIFVNSATAWQFLRDCNDAGVEAEVYPPVDGRCSVQVEPHALVDSLVSYRRAHPIVEET